MKSTTNTWFYLSVSEVAISCREQTIGLTNQFQNSMRPKKHAITEKRHKLTIPLKMIRKHTSYERYQNS